jgi:hypothetical protein
MRWYNITTVYGTFALPEKISTRNAVMCKPEALRGLLITWSSPLLSVGMGWKSKLRYEYVSRVQAVFGE